MRTLILLLSSALLVTPAAAQEVTRSVKLSKGKAKVVFATGPTESAATPLRHPRVGVAPSPTESFGNRIARHLDESAKAITLPPSQLSAASPFSRGFEQFMRSELTGSVSAACRQGRLDYLLVLGAPQFSTKTDITAMILFIGKNRTRNRQQSRLYECRSTTIVWSQDVLFETSRGVVNQAFGGVSAGGAALGSTEAEDAFARLYSEKLVADMGW